MRQKNLIGLATVLGLLVAVGIAQAGSFPDVSDASKHFGAIEFLKSQGLIGGYPDGTFKPDGSINRAEALKIVSLARKQLLGEDAGTLKTISFPDVKKSDWFYDYVQKAFTLGIVQGYDDGTFKPANQITAAESLKVIESGLVKDFNPAAATEDSYTDVKVSAWYAPFVAYGKGRQLIEAKADGSYDPERQMSRGDFAEIIYRMYYVEQNKLDKFPLSLNWQACNNFNVGYKIKYPFDWEKITAGDEMIFWKKDEGNGQVSFARVYPNSAVVIVAVDKNPQKLDLQKYIDTIEYGDGSSKNVITLNGMPYASIFLANTGLQDSYFQLADGQILIIYAQTGDGDLSGDLKEQIRYLIGSARESHNDDGSGPNCLTGASAPVSSGDSSSVSTTTSAPETVIAELLSLVLVDGKATQALNMIDDEILSDTDSIGIGTGPVDYYYSAKLDLTLKIDRNANTVLATKKTKTTAF